jgi:hypothetical protein
MKKRLMLIAVTPLMLAIVGKAAMAQQEVKAEKTNAPTITVFVNNDRVKAYEGRFKPGDKTAGTGNRPARVEFAITDGHMRNYYPDGKVEEVTWKAGEVKWSESATFRQENIGKSEFKIRVVQLK